MQKRHLLGHILWQMLVLAAVANCVPTSVLVQNSGLTANANANQIQNIKTIPNLKVKPQALSSNGLEKKPNLEIVPASFNAPPSKQNRKAQMNGDTAATGQLSQLRKRGINSLQPYLYGANDVNNNNNNNNNISPYWRIALGLSNNGIWSDDVDSSLLYADPPTETARLPSIRNSYDSEQLPTMPLQYLSHVDRLKRAKANQFNKIADLRFKRANKLTPADLLALVALIVQADEESYPIEYGSHYDYPVDETDEVNADDYYGISAMPREQTYSDVGGALNQYPKRYMVANNKMHPMGNFYNMPVKEQSVYFSPNGEKYF